VIAESRAWRSSARVKQWSRRAGIVSFPTDSTEDLTPLSRHGGYVASILTNDVRVLETDVG